MSDQEQLIKFTCPFCGKRIAAPVRLGGKDIRCPQEGCNRDLRIPELIGSTGMPASQPPPAQAEQMLPAPVPAATTPAPADAAEKAAAAAPSAGPGKIKKKMITSPIKSAPIKPAQAFRLVPKTPGKATPLPKKIEVTKAPPRKSVPVPLIVAIIVGLLVIVALAAWAVSQGNKKGKRATAGAAPATIVAESESQPASSSDKKAETARTPSSGDDEKRKEETDRLAVEAIAKRKPASGKKEMTPEEVAKYNEILKKDLEQKKRETGG